MKNDHSVVKIKSFFAEQQFLLAPPVSDAKQWAREQTALSLAQEGITEIKKPHKSACAVFLRGDRSALSGE
ncbi:hypothetical protein [Aeromonas veronii]|uniref:hypothetical protein n=1 Tax=Aeromonas veronii TaxID=654 RepID=UPI0011173D5F|nr:hypothetical protein [Aeromonas veronii]